MKRVVLFILLVALACPATKPSEGEGEGDASREGEGEVGEGEGEGNVGEGEGEGEGEGDVGEGEGEGENSSGFVSCPVDREVGAICEPIFDDTQCPAMRPAEGALCPLDGLQCSWCNTFGARQTLWCEEVVIDAPSWVDPGSCFEEK